MTESVNELLHDAAIHHSIDLEHYKNHVVSKVISLLNRSDEDLFKQLTEALDRLDPERFTVQRLEALLDSAKELNAQAYVQVGKELAEELKDFTAYEAGYQKALFESVIPAQVLADVRIVGVAANQVYAAAMARPFQGVLLKEVLKDLSESRQKMIRDQVRIGYVENEPVAAIVKRIRGTRSMKYADGLMEAPRRHVETIVRTAISHTAAYTREQFYKENSDLIKAVVWTATLDNRTSAPCRARDQKRYTASEPHKPIGHNLPWGAGPGQFHFNCRSTSVPVTKSWKELGGVDIGEFNPATRASMDGQVPAETTYAQWFKKQSAARQDEILGPTRGKLYREGGIELDAFSNNKGKLYTLDELRERDTQAFKRAQI